MKKRILILGGTSLLVVLASVASAFAWNASYECVSNDVKKEKLTLSFLDSEVVRTREGGKIPDRYYRVTDSEDEQLLEAAILAYRNGEKGHLIEIEKGKMNLTMTHVDASTVMVSIKVGKVAHTFSCK